MTSLKFSIVTPSFNQGGFIQATIDSVLTQDFSNVEYFVMDGGSTDSTLDVLKAVDDPRMKWVSEPDKGQSDAINKGMRQVTGDILAYLNSDDVYLPGAFTFAAEFFERNPEVDILYGQVHTINQTGQEIGPDYLVGPITLEQFFTRRFKFPQQAVFWRKRVTEAIGLFDESLHYQMDYDYWMRALIAGFKFQHTDRFLAQFREHGESKTVSQAVKFWKDWQTIIDKIYQRDDLTPEMLALKPLAYAYVHHHAAVHYIKYGQAKDARPHLREVLSNSASPSRLKVVSLAMLIDSYLHTPFWKMLQSANQSMKAG